MIRYTTGNLLDAPVEALVNTVNTVGVMGKGIALMFKERFPDNMARYAAACKSGQVTTGKMFITETGELLGPRWIINFPTKQHWRSPSQMVWIQEGLQDLRHWLVQHHVKSIAIPPLGAGNGGLPWPEVKQVIEGALGDLDIEILLFEPSNQYQNVAKRTGVEHLTPARALIAELVRRYWFLGMECSLLEIQKLAWFLARFIRQTVPQDPLQLHFTAHHYGPYANNLAHLLNAMDGSYLKSDKRIPDSKPFDVIWFNDDKKQQLAAYLHTEARAYLPALEQAAALIDGFESPYGMELLATVDWLINQEGCEPTVEALRAGLLRWPKGEKWARRKAGLFDDKSLQIALTRLQQGFSDCH
ncbi:MULTISPECIES: type II toxin-antitoxin system antitoxin DNA ADP-ribosyl glycohydrolase DarG [Aeromonas]|uniref:type II toxin-antitoxin system antitoxin DNA ADP-ribosyl glycohydrolase DarG n=1 Tax=Aeromonas TaxID=642 RepID=UPI0038CF953A